MDIFEKVTWLAKCEWGKLSDFFSWESIRKIKKSYWELEKIWYHFGYELLNRESLEEFYKLYQKEIESRRNWKVHNLIEKLSWELKLWILYFVYIKDNQGNLMWWWIWIKRDNKFILSFKAHKWNKTVESKMKVWIGTLIDYLIFKIAIERIKSKYISFWTDRNGYGFLWAKPSLAIWKMIRKFLPYTFTHNQAIKVKTWSIQVDTILFTNPSNIDNQYPNAILYVHSNTSEIEIKQKYWILLNNDKIISKILRYS